MGSDHPIPLVQVADASPIPTMVYNFPGVTAGLDLDSDIIFTLSAHPNIVGTKLSCGNIGKIQRLASRLKSSEFAVFSGRSDAFIHGLNAGSAGLIAALVNLIPQQHVEIFQSWDEIRVSESMQVQAKLGHADWAISKIGGVGGIKAVIVKNFGYGQPYVRGPLSAVDPDSLEKHQNYGILAELIAREEEVQ
jgi:dihydrodipicolinate synthase/N-acetylneuraminate lyase